MNLVFGVGFFAAAFVPTFLVSRIIFRLTKQWEGSMKRLALANLTSGAICIAIFLASGAWFAHGFDFAWGFGVANFAAAQAIWFAVDVYSDWNEQRFSRERETS